MAQSGEKKKTISANVTLIKDLTQTSPQQECMKTGLKRQVVNLLLVATVSLRAGSYRQLENVQISCELARSNKVTACDSFRSILNNLLFYPRMQMK